MTVTEMLDCMAGSTRFELATSGLTVQCANQAAPRARIETALGYTTPCPVATVWCALRVSDSARRGATSGMQALTGLPGPGEYGAAGVLSPWPGGAPDDRSRGSPRTALEPGGWRSGRSRADHADGRRSVSRHRLQDRDRGLRSDRGGGARRRRAVAPPDR